MIPILLITGFAVGMGINYLSDVLPASRKLTKPACRNCHASRSWSSFLAFQSCQDCGQKPSLRSFLTPLVYMGLAIYLYFFPGHRLGIWPMILLLAYFGLVFINDLEYRVVLFQVSIAGLALAAIYGYFLHGLLATLLGGAAGFIIMYLFYLGGGWFIRFLSKRRGEEVNEVALGFGDVSMSAVIGLLLGWPGIAAGLMIGIIAGGLVSGLYLIAMLLSRRYQALAALPYTPFLILGAIVLLFIKG